MATDFRTQEPEAPQWWQEMRDLEHRVLLTTIVVVIVSFALYGFAQSIKLVDDFAANVITEVISVAFTVTIIDRLNRKELEEQRKEEIILQMGSPDNAFALEAVRLLKRKKWLTDGSLHGVDFGKANLENAALTFAVMDSAYFMEANLQQANLMYANLERAYMREANLQKAMSWFAKFTLANLSGANLQEAHLSECDLRWVRFSLADMRRTKLVGSNLFRARFRDTDLREARLGGTYLQHSHFRGADLRMASLKEANLINASFDNVKFDENTILPDGSKWSPDIDMNRFTDPDHPNFWEPPERVWLTYEGYER